MNIFRTYDIRGKFPREINGKIFYQIGLRLNQLGYKKIVIGRDARLSSDELFNQFCKGILDSGIDIIDIGVVTSPMLSFHCAKNKNKGAMITASHNPKDYNGIKFIDENGIQLDYDSFLSKIEKLLKKRPISSKIKGMKEYLDPIHGYRENFFSKIKTKFRRELKVVFDCSNGVAGIPLASLLPNFYNISTLVLNDFPDGNFPAHGCDTTLKENYSQIINEVRKSSADIGIMFDGDADRVAFVDEKGNIVPLDIAFLLLAQYEMDKNNLKNPKAIFDLRFSRHVKETLIKRGVKVNIMRVGNPFYKREMNNDKTIVLGGELSGHFMYGENYGIDDALYAAFKMIELLSENGNKLSDIIKANTKYFTTGELSISAKKPAKVIERIKEIYKEEHEEFIDGISVEKKDVWFNVRRSNTEPLVRIEVGGTNLKKITQEKNKIMRIIKNTK